MISEHFRISQSGVPQSLDAALVKNISTQKRPEITSRSLKQLNYVEFNFDRLLLL